MIIRLHKVLFCGNRQELNPFCVAAQEAGFLEFLGENAKRSLDLPEDAKTLVSAIKVAKQHEIHEEEAPSFSLDPLTIAEKILRAKAALEAGEEKRRILQAEIARVSIFGDFSEEDREAIERDGKRVIQFYCMKRELYRKAPPLAPELLYVGTEYDLAYFVGIHKEHKTYEKMIEILVEKPLGKLLEERRALKEEIAAHQRDLKRYANALPRLQEALLEALSAHHLAVVKYDAEEVLDNSLFAIEAWVPETKKHKLSKLVAPFSVEYFTVAVEEKDQMPTCMENQGGGKVGEDLVRIYDIPAPSDKDPSWWVLLFFSLFFAMIVSDAGYGLLYLALSLFLKFRFPRLKGLGKRFIRLSLLCSLTTIVWGAMASSYFGMEIHPERSLRKFSLFEYLAERKAAYHLEMRDDVYEEYVKDYPALSKAESGREFLDLAVKQEGKKEVFEALDTFYDNLLMEFSFLVGMLHISLSLLRNLRRSAAGIGWVIFIWGGYLFFPSMLDATILPNFLGWMTKPAAHALGLYMIYGGIGAALLLAAVQKGWGALHELLNVIQVFADILSYLRLYALALGGLVMARTFNDQLGMELPFILGALITLAGHAINITLTTMGGVIHGLRLNFLEWYHYCFEGGGRLFHPLRLYHSNRK